MTIDIRDRGQEWIQDSEQMARNIWLAGLGVYSKSLEEAAERRDQTESLFDSLVDEGRNVEAQTRENVAQQVKSANQNVEARVQALFARLSGVDPRRIDQLNAKVDRLTELVAKLAQN
ncbi:phasin family protein [Ferrimonas balearica]|uniref:phasin family protein n=1 Tax=Ferrimonas balearica TaxID=44012 RepID=UPI001C991F0B|nr:phasin family protein [Ferrimonas balearica]MBY5922847.1 phasin family protein [Ferrimonas balearica]MBY5997776.1 phasin family protein [Ferrimonas balearica]